MFGPTGPSSLIGVNVLPGGAPATGSAGTVDLLTGDGTVAQLALPTTSEGMQQGLAPVGSLAGTLLGAPAGGAVPQLANGLSPAVAAVTSTVDQVTSPVLGTVNGALAPVTGPLVDGNGPLAPVTGLAENLIGGVTGTLGGGAAGSTGGSLAGVNAGGNVLTGPVTGNGTADPMIGVNVLPSGNGAVAGQLATASVLSQGNLVELALPATAAGVETGLQPAGNLAGGLLGAPAGATVDQAASGVAPVVAAVTGPVSGVIAPLLDTVNGSAPAVPGGQVGSPLAPVTGVVNGVLAPATGSGGATAPATGVLGGLLGGGN